MYLKELIQSKGNMQRALKERMLIEMYNQLYVINMRYRKRLQITFEEEVLYVDEDGNERKQQMPVIQDIELWNTVIDETSRHIHSNIHLLEYEDLIKWRRVEDADQEEYFFEDEVARKYEAFEEFLKQSSSTYGRLYHEFHLKFRQRYLERKRKLNTKIKKLKKNPFLTKSQIEVKKRAIEQQIEQLKRDRKR